MKTLIIYATKYGCTKKATDLLKSKLNGDSFAVNIMEANVPKLKEYDTVVLGGSVYKARVQKQLSDFMNRNIEELCTKKLGLFICGGEQDTGLIKKQINASFPEILLSHAITKECFGGELYIEKISFVEKHLIRIIKGIKEGYKRLSEDKISTFAASLSSSSG